MSDRSDSLLKRLSQIDPTRVDPGPAEGSRRYQSILETAMRDDQYSDTTAPTNRSYALPRWRRRWVFAAAAAVVVAAAAVVIVLTQPQHVLTPEAAVAAAAVKLGDATTLRGTLVRQDSALWEDGTLHDFQVTNTFAVEGANVQGTVKSEGEGQAPTSDSYVVIGGKRWDTQNGSTTVQIEMISSNPDERRAPFGAASKALLEAALRDASVVNAGSELVRGRPATRYHIEPAQNGRGPLAQLPASVLVWFQLESLEAENVRARVDVWVSDGAIVRMTVNETLHVLDRPIVDGKTVSIPDTPSSMTIEFYDYGADIHINPPAGS